MKAAQAEKRNAKVVVLLFGALTAGAGILLWMEPRTAGARSSASLLMMETNPTYESVNIQFVEGNRSFQSGDFDCILSANGDVAWQPQQTALRFVVVGDRDRLTEAQADQLLTLLGNLNREYGLDLRNVHLTGGSDPRRLAAAPAGLHDLAATLKRQGILP